MADGKRGRVCVVVGCGRRVRLGVGACARHWPAPEAVALRRAIAAAVDRLDHLFAVWITPANRRERVQVTALAEVGHEGIGGTLELADVGQRDTGADSALTTANHGIRWEVVKLDQAKLGFVLLLRRRVERPSFAWATRFRRLAKDYERRSIRSPGSTPWT